jgi:hypothetical protein
VFNVEIWGTVASWVGVGTTGGAAVAAAGYYLHDKQLEAKAQARQVRALIVGHIPKFTAEVFNYSDKMIYDMVAETHPMTLMETLVYRKTALKDGATGKSIRPNAELLAKLQGISSGAPGRTALTENDRALRPFDKVTASYEKPWSPAVRYSVVFRDYMSRRWRLEYWTDAGETHARLAGDDPDSNPAPDAAPT